MYINSESVTFAPFDKEMPAFLHNSVLKIFDADCSVYHVIFITDLSARQGRSCKSGDGHKHSIHAHQYSKLSLKACYHNKSRCLGTSFFVIAASHVHVCQANVQTKSMYLSFVFLY